MNSQQRRDCLIPIFAFALWAPFQIATVSLRCTCKTCYFVGPWGPYRPLLTKIKTGINPV